VRERERERERESLGSKEERGIWGFRSQLRREEEVEFGERGVLLF